jgi:hypothetical protein
VVRRVLLLASLGSAVAIGCGGESTRVDGERGNEGARSGTTGDDDDPPPTARGGSPGTGAIGGSPGAGGTRPVVAGAGGFPGVGGVGVTGGAGGTIVVGGASGAGNVTDPCAGAPAVELELSPWEPPELPAALEDVLLRVIYEMPGEWRGIVTTPWKDPYEVIVTFTADGGYSGACTWASNECCHAFDYGTDDDTPLKRYSVDTVSRDGSVSGSIDIIFRYDTGFMESGYQGLLVNIELDATLDRLRFDFMYGMSGPLVYDLERVSPG